MSKTKSHFTLKMNTVLPRKSTLCCPGLDSNLSQMWKTCLFSFSCFLLRIFPTIMSQIKRRAFVIIFPFGKKRGGRRQRTKWDAPVFGFVPSRMKCFVGGIYFPGTLGRSMYVGGRWRNALNAFVIIKSSAGRAARRACEEESMKDSCWWLTSLFRRCGCHARYWSLK